MFKLVGEQILDNAWTGYHCSLFAYGQTGSGKFKIIIIIIIFIYFF